LTIVRGPGGGGKTTLLAEWAASRSAARRGVWLNIEDAMTTRLAFWRAVSGAVGSALDDSSSDDLRALPTALATMGNVDELRPLLVSAFRAVRSDLVIVLDKYERIDDRVVDEDMIHILENTPALQIIVTQQWPGFLESPSVGVRLDTVLLTPFDLRFTDGETAALLLAVGRPPAEVARMATEIHAATQGLPLSIRAVGQSLPRGLSPGDVQEAATPYLGAVLESRGLDEQLHDFLMRLSVVETATSDLAGRITGSADPAARLDRAEALGLGLWSGDRFSFGRLVRSALYAELEATLPAEVSDLKRAAADALAAQGEPLPAFTLALAADYLEGAAAIARTSWFEITSYNAPEVIAAVGSIPLSRIRRYPFLALVLALAYNTSGMHRVRALEMFGMAVASAHLIGNRAEPVDRVFLLTLQSVALRVVGQSERAQAAAEQALQLLAELPIEAFDQIAPQVPTLLNHNGLTLFYCGRLDAALAAFQRSYTMSSTGGARTAFLALAYASGVHAVAGDGPEAARLLAEIDAQPWPAAWRDDQFGSMYRVARAFLALERFDFDGAREQIAAVTAQPDPGEHWALIAYLQALIDLGGGRAEAASIALDSAIARRGGKRPLPPFIRAQLSVAQATIYQAAGHPAQAESVLAALPRACNPWLVAARSRAALVTGRAEMALQILTDDVSAFRSGPPRQRVEAYLLAAAAAARMGRMDTALSCAERADGLMADRGLRFPLMLVPRADLEALTTLAAERGVPALRDMLTGIVVPSVLPDRIRVVNLTDRETVVLGQLAHTGNTAEIAAALFVSVNTIKSQLRSLYRKLGAGSREEALLVAREAALLGDDAFPTGGPGPGRTESRRPA